MELRKRRSELISAFRQDAGSRAEVWNFEQHCLGPIIEMQAPLIIAQLCQACKREHKAFHVYKADEQIRCIKGLLEDQVRERYLIIGTVLAFFTREELSHYFENRQQVNKLIIRILLKVLEKERHLLVEA